MRHKDYSFMSRALVLLTLCLLVLLWTGCGGGSTVATPGGDELAGDKTVMKKPPKPPPEPPADAAIVYTADKFGVGGTIRVMNTDGENQFKVYGPFARWPSWSADGEKIVFSDNYSLFTINLDGSGLYKVVGFDSIGARSLAWSPAAVPGRGFRIAFSKGEGTAHRSDICLISPDGGTVENLHNTADIHELDPTWSPDATRLAYSKSWKDEVTGVYPKEMWVHDFTTGEATRVELGGPFSNFDVGFHDLDWARTQDKIAFKGYTSVAEGPTAMSGYEIWIVDLADPANPVQLTDDPTVHFSSPSWSPDDTEIVYCADHEIWRMNADGSGKTLLAKPTKNIKTVHSPDWKR